MLGLTLFQIIIIILCVQLIKQFQLKYMIKYFLSNLLSFLSINELNFFNKFSYRKSHEQKISIFNNFFTFIELKVETIELKIMSEMKIYKIQNL